jgi:hypothetical protein
MATKICPFDVDIASDAGPADLLHHIAAVYSYRFYRPDAEVAPRGWAARLADASEAVKQADLLLRDAVAESREQGATWDEIGKHFGTTRQAAQMRWGNRG